jgi:hypothetical protein
MHLQQPIFCALFLGAVSTAAFAADAAKPAPAAASGNIGNFAGKWASDDKKYNLTLNPNGSGDLMGTFGVLQHDKISWTNCSATGNALNCNWTGTYHDELKDITRHGTLTATLAGDKLSGQMKVAKVDKEEFRSPKYPSMAQKDRSFTYMRSK